MQHDAGIRMIARAIYHEVYPFEEWAPYAFEEAERLDTIHYRQAVGAAQTARALIGAGDAEQPSCLTRRCSRTGWW